jgi:galactose-1-phosphate uridylyltransferase
MILFEEQEIEASVPKIAGGGSSYEKVSLVRRYDPLFGHGCRIIQGTKLTESAEDLSGFLQPEGFCPFCAPNVESATAPFPADIVPTTRIRVGKSWVAPNIVAYSAVSSVVIYDTERHFLTIEDFDRDLIYDAFLAVITHMRAYKKVMPDLAWSSINANYLPPSGSSLLHPHLQSSLDPVPLGSQTLISSRCAEHKSRFGRSYFEQLVELEELNNSRFVGRTGPFAWVVPFAPSGFYEVWAINLERGEPADLADDEVFQLATGLAFVFSAYASKGLNSFNFSLTSAGPGYLDTGARLLMRVTARSPFAKWYRSDVTYFERLGHESMIDYVPESWAAELRQIFGGLS